MKQRPGNGIEYNRADGKGIDKREKLRYCCGCGRGMTSETPIQDAARSGRHWPSAACGAFAGTFRVLCRIEGIGTRYGGPSA